MDRWLGRQSWAAPRSSFKQWRKMPGTSNSQRPLRTGQRCCCQAMFRLPAHALHPFLLAQKTGAHGVKGAHSVSLLAPHPPLPLSLSQQDLSMTSLDKNLQWLPSAYRIRAPLSGSVFEAPLNLTSTKAISVTHSSSCFPGLPPPATCLSPPPGFPRDILWAFKGFTPPAWHAFLPLGPFSLWKVLAHSSKPCLRIITKPLILPDRILPLCSQSISQYGTRACLTHKRICLFPCVCFSALD